MSKPAIVFLLAAAASLLTATSAHAFAPGLGSPLGVASGPFSTAIADFDGDGRPDLAVASEHSNDVTVLLRQPNGGFATEGAPVPVGGRPSHVVAADFDSDGRTDLAVADFGSDEVTVLLRRPGGGFAEEDGSPIAVQRFPASLAVADFNGDDRPDLAVANQASNSVSILIREPGGGFSEEDGSPVAVGSGPFALAAEDFDGDGRSDLAVTNYVSDDVTILLRRAAGGFVEEAGSPVPVGNRPLELVAGDYDGDERADLAVADQGSDQMTILLRQADGGFAEAPGSPIAMPDGPYGVRRAELDGDGRPDLAVTNEFADNVSILLGRPGGAFVAAPGTPVAAGKSPLRLDAADLDGDSRTDLAIPDWGADAVTVLVNQVDTEITAGPSDPTNDATPTFEFRSSHAAATFECRVDGGSFAACDTPHTTAPLDDGEHTFQVRAVDGLGNTDPTPAERTVVVDTVAPDTTITDGPPDGAAIDAPPVYAFESSEPHSTFECATIFAPGSLLERSKPFSCTSGMTIPQPSEGANAFKVSAVDAAGNADPTPASRGFTLHAGPPRNVVRPVIVRQSAVQGGGFRCDAGTWELLPPSPVFEYEWLRRESTGGVGGAIPKDYTVRATTRTFAPGKDDEGREFACRVTAHNAAGATQAASDSRLLADDLFDSKVATVYGNFRIRGIDVFQTVQPNSGAQMFQPAGPATIGFPTFPGGGTPTSYVPGSGVPAQQTAYKGVSMDVGKPGTAVVYVDMTQLGSSNEPLVVTLRAPGIGTQTQEIPRPPMGSFPWVSTKERDDPRFGVQFALYDWLAKVGDGTLDLEASVSLRSGTSSLVARECPLGIACSADNRFTLTGVPVARVAAVHVVSVELRSGGQAQDSLNPPLTVLSRARQLFPGGDAIAAFPAASIDVSLAAAASGSSPACLPFKTIRDCRGALVQSAMEQWFTDNEQTANAAGHYDIMLGIHNYRTGDLGADFIEPGWTARGYGDLTQTAHVPLFTANDGSANRPITAAAHEFGHVTGAPHADLGCGGNSNGQVGEAWAPDNQGRLQGVKFDDHAPLANGRTDPAVDGPAVLYDLMSYCPSGAVSDKDHWLSAYNWNRAFATLRAYHSKGTASRTLHAATRTAFATGVVGPRGGRIISVVAPDGADAVPAAVDSPVRLRSFAADGRVLSDVGVTVSELSDGAGATFVGPVPRAASRVSLVRDGDVLDTRTHGHAPWVGRLTVRGLQVRWTSSDPDAGPLTAGVDYSADGGRSWRTVASGPDRGRATLPEKLLQRSRRARVRVNISDGFDEAHAVSRRLRVAGARPTVRILRPAAGEDAQQPTLLVGAASDDAHRDLHGRALTWYAGYRRLGTGERLNARLPLGRVVLRLVARDRMGRTAASRRIVRVSGAPPRAHLAYAERVRRGATAIAVRVSLAARGTLRAAGRRYRVGPRPRRIHIGLPSRPARGLLTVPFSITSRGSRTSGTIATVRP